MRNGADWVNACSRIKTHKLKSLFSSAQCSQSTLNYNNCLQSKNDIIQFTQIVPHSTLFVSTDYNSYKSTLSKHFKVYELNDLITVEKPWQKPFIELAIHSKSDLFIANCVSSFSAFAVKRRRVNNLPVRFWGVYSHDEL